MPEPPHEFVHGGPPDFIRAIARRVYGLAASDILANMNISKRYKVRLHGVDMQLHQHAEDVMVRKLVSEFGRESRYRLDRLNKTRGYMVDVGCNLGDASIAAWLTNPAMQVLCLEPMPVTYLYLLWNLQANRVPFIDENSFGSHEGGLLALPFAATSDGRSVTIVYSPTLSGFGVSSASVDKNGDRNGTLLGWKQLGFNGVTNGVQRHVNKHDFRRSNASSLNLPLWLGHRGIRSLRFMKMDCEGCEHEVLPSMATTLLKHVDHFEGELHICTGRVSCSFDIAARLATARALCAAGHNCKQCFCGGHKPDLIESSSLPWEPTADPCLHGACERKRSSRCTLFYGRRFGEDSTPSHHCDLGPATLAARRRCPNGVTCWQYPAFPKAGNLYYNVLPRHGMPPKEAVLPQGR